MTKVVLAAEINLPRLDYAAMSPMLILFAAACVGVLVEAYVPREYRHPTQFLLGVGALIGSVAAIVRMAGSERRSLTAGTALAVDGPALFMQATLAVLGIVALLLMADRVLERGGPFVAQAAIPSAARPTGVRPPRRGRPSSFR
jgi:NADH-quinone oxidoreductase subunit N